MSISCTEADCELYYEGGPLGSKLEYPGTVPVVRDEMQLMHDSE